MEGKVIDRFGIGKWIKIDDIRDRLIEWHYLPEAPVSNGHYLAVSDGDSRGFIAHYENGKWVSTWNSVYLYKPYAWAELPKAPKK